MVFEDIEHYKARVDDPKLDIDETCVHGAEELRPEGLSRVSPRSATWPAAKLLKKGVTDMVRISDARMSGTAYGTVVLHTSPEAAAGGPLALVRDGDMIELDVKQRRVHLDVSDEELERRREAWVEPAAARSRLLAGLSRPCHAGGHGLRFRLSGRLIRRAGAARKPLSGAMLDFRFDRAAVNGMNFTTPPAASRDAPLMLFLHGFPEYWAAWKDVMPHFAATHFCVAPDQRGYNLSSKPEGVEELWRQTSGRGLSQLATATVSRTGRSCSPGMTGAPRSPMPLPCGTLTVSSVW